MVVSVGDYDKSPQLCFHAEFEMAWEAQAFAQSFVTTSSLVTSPYVLWLWGIHKANALLKIVHSSCKCYYNSDIQILNLLCSVKNSCEQRHPFLILSWAGYWMSQRLSPEAGAVWEFSWGFFTPVSSPLICWCCWTQRTSEWESRKWIKRKWGVAKMKWRK